MNDVDFLSFNEAHFATPRKEKKCNHGGGTGSLGIVIASKVLPYSAGYRVLPLGHRLPVLIAHRAFLHILISSNIFPSLRVVMVPWKPREPSSYSQAGSNYHLKLKQ